MEVASLTNREEIEKKILSCLHKEELSHYVLMQMVFGIADITEINRVDDREKSTYQEVLDNLVKEEKVTKRQRNGGAAIHYYLIKI